MGAFGKVRRPTETLQFSFGRLNSLPKAIPDQRRYRADCTVSRNNITVAFASSIEQHCGGTRPGKILNFFPFDTFSNAVHAISVTSDAKETMGRVIPGWSDNPIGRRIGTVCV
jgi:hypothetical protein